MRRLLRHFILSFLPGIILSFFVVAAVVAQPVELIRFARIGGSLQLRFLNEKRVQPLQSSHPYFKETLTLRNKGYFVSPKILEFEWGVVLGLMQDRYSSEEFSRFSHGKFLNGFFTGTFFKKARFPLTFIWNRTNQNMIFKSGGYTSYEIQKFQVNWVLSRFVLNGILWAETRRLKENWYQLDRLTRRDQTQQIINYSGQNKRLYSEFNFRYRLRNIKDHIDDSRSHLFQNAQINFQKILNHAKTNIWNNSFSFFSRKSKKTRYYNLDMTETLALKHRYGLSTNYSYSLSTITSNAFTSFVNSGFATIQHQLFESLTSYATLSGTYQSMNTGKEKSYAFTRGLNYNKKLPFKSKIQITYKKADGKTDRQMKNVVIRKVGEKHLILNDAPIFLDEPNVLTNTIVVYNQEGDIFYEEGENKDYVIETIGDMTQIIRTPLSRIRLDQVILVDYDYRALPSILYSTRSNSFGASFTFNRLGMYYKRTVHKQTLLSGMPQFGTFLRDVFFELSGLKFLVHNKRAGISLLAEQRRYQTQVIDYTQRTVRNGFFVRITDFLIFSTRLSFIFLEYPKLSETMKIYGGQIQLEWNPTSVFSVSTFAGLRKQNRTSFAEQRNFEYGGKAQWLWRTMRLSVIYRAQDWLYAQRKTIFNHFTVEFERFF